ncbi:MAG: alpha/beta hydrolase [Haloarculaceae archaeon]
MTETDASLLDSPSAASSRVTVADGVELHVVRAGDPADPLLVLLHGFPDFWYGWRRQVPALVEAGFRVLVPDQRGYNLSDRPRGLDAYRMGRLSGDVADIVDAAGRESAHVLGHDWGGGVAWDFAMRYPDAIDRLGVINAPHPGVMERAITTDPRQLRRSWYFLYFQLPRLPEWYLARDDAAGVVRTLRETSAPGAFADAEFSHYRAAFAEAETARAAVDWYRAVVRRRDPPPRDRVEAPALLVWGDEDFGLLPELADRSLERCTTGRLERVADGSHWVHREEPGRVNALLVEHFGE